MLGCYWNVILKYDCKIFWYYQILKSGIFRYYTYDSIEISLRSVLGKLCQVAGWCNGWSVRNKGGTRAGIMITTDNFHKREKIKRQVLFFQLRSAMVFPPFQKMFTGPSTFQLRNKGDEKSWNKTIFTSEKKNKITMTF